jgi:hypothetical protein
VAGEAQTSRGNPIPTSRSVKLQKGQLTIVDSRPESAQPCSYFPFCRCLCSSSPEDLYLRASVRSILFSENSIPAARLEIDHVAFSLAVQLVAGSVCTCWICVRRGGRERDQEYTGKYSLLILAREPWLIRKQLRTHTLSAVSVGPSSIFPRPR